jgi:hypothetical protein
MKYFCSHWPSIQLQHKILRRNIIDNSVRIFTIFRTPLIACEFATNHIQVGTCITLLLYADILLKYDISEDRSAAVVR